MNLLPKAKRVYSKLVGASDEEIQRCKINFREDRLKSLLDGEKFVFDESRHTPKRELEVKPIGKPMNTLLYVNYTYESTPITTKPKKRSPFGHDLIQRTKSNILFQIREAKLQYILCDKKRK